MQITEEFTQTTFHCLIYTKYFDDATKKYRKYKLLHFKDLCGSGIQWI